MHRGKAPVSKRALLARANRKLAKEGRKLVKVKADSAAHAELGGLYLIDTARDEVERTHVDLEAIGRELGVLADHERLES